MSFNSTLVFPAGSVDGDTMCVNITIIDDDKYEKTHSFTIHILSTGGNVNITSPMYAAIFILDNEGIYITLS